MSLGRKKKYNCIFFLSTYKSFINNISEDNFNICNPYLNLDKAQSNIIYLNLDAFLLILSQH